MCINNNNAVINIITEGSKSLFYSSKLPRARERTSAKFIDLSGKRPQKGSTALP